MAESLSPVTKKLEESIKKITKLINPSCSEIEINQEVVPVEINSEEENKQINPRALPYSNKFSSQGNDRNLGVLMNSKSSLKLLPDDAGRATILGTPIITVGGDIIQINENIYDLTPEIHKALSDKGYTGKNMKSQNDILTINTIIRDLSYTGDGDRESKRKTFLTLTLPKLVDEIQNKTFDEIDLEGRGVKIIIPSNIIDIYTRLEVLIGLKLSGHTDTLTGASNLIDELYKRGEIQKKQQYRNALNKFSTR